MAKRSIFNKGTGDKPESIVGETGNENSGNAGPLPENDSAGTSVGGNENKLEGSAGQDNDPGGNDPNVVEEKPKRRRGRPPGTGNKTGPKKASLGVVNAQTIMGWHAMLAGLTGSPIFMLHESEAESLETALKEVAKHYNVAFDGPRAAMVQLVAVCGMIYVPRILQVKQMAAQNKRNRVPPPAPSVMEPVNGDDEQPSNGSGVDFSGSNIEQQIRKQMRRH